MPKHRAAKAIHAAGIHTKALEATHALNVSSTSELLAQDAMKGGQQGLRNIITTSAYPLPPVRACIALFE